MSNPISGKGPLTLTNSTANRQEPDQTFIIVMVKEWKIDE